MGKRLLLLACLIAAATAGYVWNRPGPDSASEIPSSERQMPDFNPPVESDRPDLWEEPRIKPDESR